MNLIYSLDDCLQWNIVPKRRDNALPAGNSVQLEYYQGPRNTTVARVVGARFSAVGVTVKHPDDKHDPQQGMDVATSRALRALADVMDQHTGIDTRG